MAKNHNPTPNNNHYPQARTTPTLILVLVTCWAVLSYIGSWFSVCNTILTQLHEIWKTTSIFLEKEDKLLFFEKRRRPQFFWKWKTTLFFWKWKTTSIFWKWKTTTIFWKWKMTSIFLKMEDDLIFVKMIDNFFLSTEDSKKL